MPVIINEFEIIPAPSPAAPEEKRVAQDREHEPPPLRPEDIERILQRLQQHLARVWAE
jgi:hypothetical protein